MLNTIRAIVREGKIELLEKVEIPDGTEVLVTPLIDEPNFWLNASESSLDSVWNNSEDDVYGELLEKRSDSAIEVHA
ncbi:MAG TPA: hypothetical protein VGB73_07075 [Pyrinomonadaceae bacterium]|jgi:hypothetical protein